jgi:hypothetical protein
VGLAIAFTGLSYLVWSLVAGVSRLIMGYIVANTQGQTLPGISQATRLFFVDTGFVIDLVGLVWLVGSLVLILLANWQWISISWAWTSALCQSMVAGLGGVLVAWAAFAPFLNNATGAEGTLAKLSQISLPVVIGIAVVVWVMFVLWLISGRGNRSGPTLHDGLRTNR